MSRKTGPYGLVGNEDVGQISAWYVLAALGPHPICPGEPIYILTSPLFPRATLRLDPAYAKGRAFTITALHAEDPAAIYIQLAKLNDVALDRAWLTHDEISAGGTLEFTLGREPQPRLEHRPSACLVRSLVNSPRSTSPLRHRRTCHPWTKWLPFFPSSGPTQWCFQGPPVKWLEPRQMRDPFAHVGLSKPKSDVLVCANG